MITIDPNRLARLMADQPALDLIDVRSHREFNHAHLPGARSIPLDLFIPAKVLHDRKGKQRDPVFIIGEDRIHSGLAAGMLRGAGCTLPVVLKGGMETWEQLGLPAAQGGFYLLHSSSNRREGKVQITNERLAWLLIYLLGVEILAALLLGVVFRPIFFVTAQVLMLVTSIFLVVIAVNHRNRFAAERAGSRNSRPHNSIAGNGKKFVSSAAIVDSRRRNRGRYQNAKNESKRISRT